MHYHNFYQTLFKTPCYFTLKTLVPTTSRYQKHSKKFRQILNNIIYIRVYLSTNADMFTTKTILIP